MLEEQIRQGFSPLLAVLTSDAVERVVSKNNLSFTDLLLPFATVNCTIRDPSGTSQTSRISFDFRDLRRDGFLLSLTVLPFVLHEAVSSVAFTSEADLELASAAFSETLLKWSEPADHEFLRTYLGCLFVVATNDKDPVKELSKLVSVQHQQQYGQNASPIGPAYCVLPRWMLSSIFKYYLILDDESSGIEHSRVSSIFTSICTEYGAQNCYLLKVNSKYDDELTDPWRAHLESKYRGLEKGLVLAKEKVLSKTVKLTDSNTVTTESSLSPEMNSSVLGASDLHAISSSGSTALHGQFLSYEDRENVTRMMDCLVRNALIPWVEQQMRILNEQVVARRGLSKSLTTGVRKWFGAAAAQQTASVTYSWDSGEMQVRRLADICFIFGLYSFAYQLYQSLRKEFAVDQAWLYNAGALEMTALSSFLSGTQITAKQYIQHYMDNAINFYTTLNLRPNLAMRAVILSSVILSSLGLYFEACTQLLKLTNSDDDLFSGVLLERASVYFGSANMRRKMAFHYVIAGHRMWKAGQKQLSRECYKRALPEYLSKRWLFAEDHILFTLANESEYKEEALSWCLPLIRSRSVQHADQQRIFLKQYLWLLKQRNDNKTHAPITVPLVDVQSTIVIYGEQSVEVTSELIANLRTLEENDENGWIILEKAAYYAIKGSFAGFRETRTISSASTNNSEVPLAPLLERIRIILWLKNSMDISLLLKNIHLEISADPALYMQTCIDEFMFEPNGDWIPFEFSIVPKENGEMRVPSLLFDLVMDEISVPCLIPLTLRGPRLNSTKKEKTSVLYGEDYRLSMKISNLRWPLLEIDLPAKRKIIAFCGQICQFDCNISNVGAVAVQTFCIASDHPELIAVCEEGSLDCTAFQTASLTPSTIDGAVGVCKLVNGALAVGQKKRLRIEVRAPVMEFLDYRIMLICYYHGENDVVRGQRHLIVIDTRLILEASLRLVEPTNGVCLLQLRNCMLNCNSSHAKVELLRVRSLVGQTNKSCSSLEIGQDSFPQISLQPLKKSRVELACGQTECMPFLANGHVGSSSLWLCDEVEDVQQWSDFLNHSPYAYSAVLRSRQQGVGNSMISELNLCIGILWRANIVNSDGTVSAVFGENFVSCPFPPGSLVRHSAYHVFRPTAVQHPDHDASGVKHYPTVVSAVGKNPYAFICKISTSSSIIYHSFSDQRSCHVRVQIAITNDDVWNRRNCSVTVHFLDSYLMRRQLPVDSADIGVSEVLSQFPNSTSLSRIHALEVAQPIVVADRSLMHAVIAFGRTHIFDVRLTVYCSSIYEVSCFRAVGLFDGDQTEVPIKVPCAYVTVIDQRVMS